jgi:SprA-related family
MILNSSQSIQASRPLESSISKRVTDTSRAPSTAVSSVGSEEADKAKLKATEQVQNQANQQMISQLQSRDREVRSHESAHTSAGGSLVVSGPSFTYQKGPDGRSYAIGGEVQLDVSPVANDPEATLKKSEQIRRAALAPADPSSQDLKVASNANQLASRARVDIALLRREEAQLEEEQKELETEQNSQGATDEVEPGGDSPSIENDLATSLELNPNASSPSQPAAISAFMEMAESSAPKLASKEPRVNQFV